MQQIGIEDPDKPLTYDGHDLKKLSIQSKYQLLQQNEHLVQMRKTRGGLKIMRMKGITQSYYIYDSQMYKIINKALREIMDGPKKIM